MTVRRRAVAVVAVLLALLPVAACGRDNGPEPSGSTYAALGDSDSSGAGIAPTADQGCLRSSSNYASLVAKRMHYTSFDDVTCAGATTSNLIRPQITSNGANEPQLDAVGTRTRLVTLTMGLNDDNLAYALLAVCQSATLTPSGTCRQLLDTPRSIVDARLQKAADHVENTLRLIRKSAPNARVVLVGYPRFFPDSGLCSDRVPMVEAWVPRVVAAFATVNRDWRQAAEAAGADYVDTYALSKGHDVCSDDPWLNGAKDAAGEAAPMHPFVAFHRAVADAITGLLGRS